MKKRPLSFALCILMIITVLSGCGLTPDLPEETGREIEPIPEEQPAPSQESYYDSIGSAEFPDSYATEDDSGYEIESDTVTDASGGLDGFTEEEITAAGAHNVGRFAYERLSSTDKRLYNQLYILMSELREEYEVDSDDPDNINRVFRCVMMDHPELFWVAGFIYTRYLRGERLEAIGVKGAFTMTSDMISSRQASIDAYVSGCLAGMPAGDDYAKIKYIYEYIVLNTDYDPAASDNQNICSVFINGRSVCQGYAKATQYLLEKAGIRATLITGETMDLGSHAWNIVFSDGAYYHLDTTWGDANYRASDSESGEFPPVSYDYLCVPDSEIYKTHTPDCPVDLPVCTAVQDNYYVRENAYFTGVDTDRLTALFDRAYDMNTGFVSIKASDPGAFAELKRYLLDEQHVFEMMRGRTPSGTVSFWENEEMLSLNFGIGE